MNIENATISVAVSGGEEEEKFNSNGNWYTAKPIIAAITITADQGYEVNPTSITLTFNPYSDSKSSWSHGVGDYSYF